MVIVTLEPHKDTQNQNNLQGTLFFDQNYFGPKTIVDRKFFGPKIILNPQLFRTQNFVEPIFFEHIYLGKSFWTQKFLNPKRFGPKYSFLQIFVNPR